MRHIMPPGYSKNFEKNGAHLTEELRKKRAAELENASEKDRSRIEKEIKREVRLRLAAKHWLGNPFILWSR